MGERRGARPAAVDALLALGLYVALTFGVTSAAEAERDGGSLVGALANLALVGPLALRRRAPLAVLAIVVVAVSVVAAGFGPTGGEAAVLVALGTVAACELRTRRVASAVAVVVAGLVVAIVALEPDALLQQLATSLAAVSAAVAIGVAARARRAQLTALADRAVRLERERAQEAELAVAAERTRIARELHDVVAHNVSVMVALAHGAQHTIDDAPDQAREAMGHVAAAGREALIELRELVGVLGDRHAERAPQPGIDQLDELVDRVRAAGLHVRLRVEGEPAALSPLAEVTLYRIAQEALTNVLRHADAPTAVDVQLRWLADGVELEILDDGRAPEPSSAGGRGLVGMRERAAVHGATLAAGPLPGAGWRVATRLPLQGTTVVRR